MNNHVMELLALAQEKRYEVCIWGAGNVGTHFGLHKLQGQLIRHLLDYQPCFFKRIGAVENLS